MNLKFKNSEKYFESFGVDIFNSTRQIMSSYLQNLYETLQSLSQNPDQENRAFETEYATDISSFKKNTYYNIKRLHDDLIGNSLNRSDIQPENKIFSLIDIPVSNIIKSGLFYNSILNGKLCDEVINDDTKKEYTKLYDLYQIFQVVDRGNNHIGNKILADLNFLNQILSTTFKGGSTDLNLQKLSEQTVITLISQLANTNGFILQQIPNYINVNGSLGSKSQLSKDDISDAVDQMFGIHTTTKRLGEGIFDKDRDVAFGGIIGFPGYIFQIGVTSSDTDDGTSSTKNNYTNSFCLDIGLADNNVKPIISTDAPKEIVESNNMSSFTIDFGKQNQQMFNSINIDTAQIANTEYSLKAYAELINKTEADGLTRNIFPVLERYRYTCEVSGLGNATIQPTNYFYLRNTPLYSGTYLITNVKHTIVPNNMTTRFQGIRQPIVSKSDTRKMLLEKFKKIKQKLIEGNTELNRVINEKIPNTSGLIKKVVNSNTPYGSIVQRVNSSINQFYEFDAQTVIGLYIVSIVGSEDDDAVYGMISYLYNLSKAFTGAQSTHTEIIKNMINAVIGDSRAKAELGDTRYKDLSLSKLFEEYGDLYSIPGTLHNLLGDISLRQEYVNKIVIGKGVNIFNVKALRSDNTQPINEQNTNISLVSEEILRTTTAEDKSITNTNIYLDPKTPLTNLAPYVSTRDFNFKTNLLTIFESFDPKTKNINTFQTKVLNLKKEIKNKNYYIKNITVNSVSKTFGNEQEFELYFKLRVSRDGKSLYELLPNFNTTEPNAFRVKGETISDGKSFKVHPNNADLNNGVILWDLDSKIGLGNYKLSFGEIKQLEIPTTLSTYTFDKDDSILDKKYLTIKQTDKLELLIGDYDPISNDETSWLTNVPIKDGPKTYLFNNKDTEIVIEFGSEISQEYEDISTNNTTKIKYYGAYGINKIAFLEDISLDKKDVKENQLFYLEPINNNDTFIRANKNNAYKSIINFVELTPWSAAFISYIVRKSGIEFPSAASHADYAQKIRITSEYPWLILNPKIVKPLVGDIIITNRGNNNLTFQTSLWSGATHGDIVTEITNDNLTAIGGNLGQTVKKTTVTLNEGLIIDGKYFVILRPQTNADATTLVNNAIFELNRINGRVETDPEVALIILEEYFKPIGLGTNVQLNAPEVNSETKKIELSESESLEILIEVLKGIGVSRPNDAQIKMMKIWRQKEGGSATYNPFNTTYKLDGTSTFNDDGVKNYLTKSDGITATIKTLKLERYTKIVEAIKNIKTNDDLDNIIQIINKSSWGSKFDPATSASYKTFNNFIYGWA